MHVTRRRDGLLPALPESAPLKTLTKVLPAAAVVSAMIVCPALVAGDSSGRIRTASRPAPNVATLVPAASVVCVEWAKLPERPSGGIVRFHCDPPVAHDLDIYFQMLGTAVPGRVVKRIFFEEVFDPPNTDYVMGPNVAWLSGLGVYRVTIPAGQGAVDFVCKPAPQTGPARDVVIIPSLLLDYGNARAARSDQRDDTNAHT